MPGLEKKMLKKETSFVSGLDQLYCGAEDRHVRVNLPFLEVEVDKNTLHTPGSGREQ